MKLKALALALFVAGACSSFAVADNGHGKNPIRGGSSTTGSTTTAASTTTSDSTTTSKTGKGNKPDKKVTICHKAGKSGRYVKISVSKNAVKSDLKHGDVLPDASGNCPAKTPTTTTQGTSTDATTTTGTTTTSTTTTNAAPTGVAPTTTTP